MRQQDQPWRDPPLSKECKSKEGVSCQMRLPDDLIKGDKYEARIRVQATRHKSTWSDWSPSESWVATVGREKPTVAQPSAQIGSPPGPQGSTHPVFRGAHRAPAGSQHKSQVLHVLQSSRAMLINEFYNTNDEETKVSSTMDLSCYNDFNNTINCVWNSTHEHQDDVCTIEAVRPHENNYYNSSCQLHPVDLSRPKQKNCTMFFRKYQFAETQTWFINISCSTKGQVLSVTYIPSCHIKLNPPPKPEVNLTTVVWFPQYPRHLRFKEYCGQLQLRQQDQPWRDPPLSKECKSEGLSCQNTAA
ncbi:uncharacterized protein LOC130521113 [Takifugu flavidus]|uniref:uncharacterized protein LOC130521113 n=1 Tax=Takifugu flavidus TaxID=433684 RepID=UPI00254454AE|nr:uncharacterized protein LOC130521113 [Takifugu flavidus]XP_056880736.1 uncharacterized protein LOC130521113 [Takifugu flavidus]XP_056880737.1 uncharacterized protein LOC130521113 [Takifugu flavidus]XP_056880738.1 uncharacterized protein LOC130521113 [Takifugu flavidus]